MNSQSRMIYSWKLNESSSLHLAETLSWMISTKVMQESTRPWPWLELCVYWPEMETDVTDYIKRCLTCTENINLPIETLTTSWGPSRTYSQVRYGLLSRPSRGKIFNHCRLLQQVPIHLSQWHPHIIPRPSTISEICLQPKAYLPLWCLTMAPPFNGDEFKRFAQEFDLVDTTSSPHFHQSNGLIEAMVKKVQECTYKKTDGSPNALGRALLQLWDTPISDRPSLSS